MFNLFNKKKRKIVILSINSFFIIFFIAGFIISLSLIMITSINLGNHVFAEFASNANDSSFVEKPFDSNFNGIDKKNFTEINNQDNSFAKMNMPESKSNNTLVSKNQDKYQTNISSIITDSIGSSSSVSNTAAQSSQVSADFNGDGSSDLAIGVPIEVVSNLASAGTVNVIYGSSNGLNGIALSPGNGRDDQIWTQAITGGLEAGDRFGSSLATGDFNNDTFSDLAIGVPNEQVGNARNAGAVNIIYGSTNGLSNAVIPFQIWTQNPLQNSAEFGDGFGFALTTGDFNKDGFSDLAIGVPFETLGTNDQAGAVNVIYGSSQGLHPTTVPNQFFTQLLTSGPIDRGPEPRDWLGYSLAAGDFDRDGFLDLAIGIPSEDLNLIHEVGTRDAGEINILYGSANGLHHTSHQHVWHQHNIWDDRSIQDNAESGDRFGSSLATGDFNKDGSSDLVIGVPGENVRGAVNVIYGTSFFGLLDIAQSPGDGAAHQLLTQASPGIEDEPESGDRFGSSLATGDFNKDGSSDLVIGVPHESIGTIGHAGAVNVIYGSSVGLSSINISPGNGRDDQLWHQNSVEFSGGAVEDDVEFNDIFGSALTTGDFNKDGISDLAIGVPHESIGTTMFAGAVNVIYGSIGITINSGGLSTTVPLGGLGRVDQLWTQDSPNIEDNVEGHDYFGSSLG
jgi:hypothetical protein